MGPFSKNRLCILLARMPLSHDLKQLSKLVKSAGCVPVKRNTIYTFLKNTCPQNLLSDCQWHEVLSMMKQTPRWMNTIGRVAFMNCDPLFVGLDDSFHVLPAPPSWLTGHLLRRDCVLAPIPARLRKTPSMSWHSYLKSEFVRKVKLVVYLFSGTALWKKCET